MHYANVEISTDDPSRIEVQTAFRSAEVVKTIPGARWSEKLRVRTLPLTWPSCIALRHEFGVGLTIGPNLRAWALVEKERRTLAASYRDLLELPEGEELPNLPGFDDLYPFQRVDARMASIAKKMIIMNPTGTGKTRSAAAAMSLIEYELQLVRVLHAAIVAIDESIFPMLVVAPKSVLINWAERELPVFFPDADIRLCSGTPARMRKALEPGGDIYVISWGGVRGHASHAHFGKSEVSEAEKVPKELNTLDFNSAILDELHRASSTSSKQTRALWTAVEGCRYVVGLTGTPYESTPDQLWPALRVVRGQHEYGNKTTWVERFIEVVENFWGGREFRGLHPINGREFLDVFDTFSRRISKEDALPFLPEKVYETRWVTLPPKLRKIYNGMRDHMMADVEGGVLTASSDLVVNTRLTQFANAEGELDEDGNFRLLGGTSPKVDAFIADLKDGDFGDKPLVIFSDSRQIADMVEIAMKKAKMTFTVINGDVTDDDRQRAVDDFQEGKVNYVICTRAGSEGITLTRASTMVRLVRPWSSIVYDQGEDRIHRIGSERHDVVTYVDYISENTVEEKQIVQMSSKHTRQQEILRDNDHTAVP